MRSFELLEPATFDEAVTLLDPADTGVRAISGGTALLQMMKARLYQPTRLVSLRRLNGSSRGLRQTEAGAVSIGAMTTLSELEQSPLLTSALPVVAETLRTLSNVRVRNVATLGGHLAHGDPHMDLPPVLLTLDARVRAVSPRGARWIPLRDLAVGYYQTSLAADELIAEIEVPAQPAGVRAAYEKCTALSADDWPAVGVAVWLRIEAARIVDARVAVSAATEVPVRIAEAEAMLTGVSVASGSFGARAIDAAEAAAAGVEPLSDIRGSAPYKREMVRVYTRRAVERARQLSPTLTD